MIVGSVDIRMGDSWMFMRLSLETFITEGKPDWGGRGRGRWVFPRTELS